MSVVVSTVYWYTYFCSPQPTGSEKTKCQCHCRRAAGCKAYPGPPGSVNHRDRLWKVGRGRTARPTGMGVLHAAAEGQGRPAGGSWALACRPPRSQPLLSREGRLCRWRGGQCVGRTLLCLVRILSARPVAALRPSAFRLQRPAGREEPARATGQARVL